MRKWYPWLLVGLAFGYSAAMYSRLPDQIPTRWDQAGGVTDYSARAWGVWLIPVVLLAIAIIVPRLPALDPRRENYEKFRPSFDLVVNAVMTMIALLHVAMLGVGAGWPIPMERITPLLMGGVFVVVGNVLPRARPNWLFGIRTPWTLSNDRVWERTHRLAGLLFVVAGVLLALSAVALPSSTLPVTIVGLVVAAVVPAVYSYFTWRQETSRVQNT
jgi:uncharacterized membrane protein